MPASILPLVLLGFLLGIRHATDADHVVAVTTIVSRQRSFWRASGVGALWGVGHTMTILAVGGAIILLHLTIPPRLGLAMEFAVAIMLIALGVYNLMGRPAHGHSHDAGGERAGLRPLLVGMVHGLAGSAAVALLVLTTVNDSLWALVYLLIFGLGTVAGMIVVTAAIAVPSLYAVTRVTHMERWLRLASGAVSVVFGLMLAHEIGIRDGLFGANPQWSPR